MKANALSAVWLIGAMCCLAVVTAGCETLNVGGGDRVDYWIWNSLTVSPGSGLHAGDTVTVTANFSDIYYTWGTGSNTLELNMGGGAEPNTLTVDEPTSPVSRDFVLSNEAGGAFTVSGTLTLRDGTIDSYHATYSYEPRPNLAPSITSVTVDNSECTFTVTTADPEGDDVTLTIADLTGGSVSSTSAQILGGNGTYTFDVSPTDFMGGGTVSGTVAASDADNPGGAGTPFTVICNFYTIVPDTLYAIPLQTTAAPGEPVTIVVATGDPADPFQFMNGVRVTAPAGFEYVSDSFNVGAPGGAADDVDGIWTAMNPTGFLLPNDNFIVETTDLAADATGASGRTGIDFNVTPLGGSDLAAASGALFNFQATFAVGNNVIGFQAVQGVSRTYFSDGGAAAEYFWSDIDNDNGLPNTVVVE